MAIDFRKISSSAKEEHDAQSAEDERNRATNHELQRRRVAAGVKILSAEIQPLLEQARVAFAEDGVMLRITPEYEVRVFSTNSVPKITVCLSKPAARDGNPDYVATLKTAEFSSRGDTIELEIKRDVLSGGKDITDNAQSGQVEKMVESAILELASSLYSTLARYS